jgi:signal transduction histidine kinase
VFKYKVALITLGTSLFCVIFSGGIMTFSMAAFFIDLLKEDIFLQTSKIAAVLSEEKSFEKKTAEEVLNKIPIFVGSGVRVFDRDFFLTAYAGDKIGVTDSLRFSEYEKGELIAGRIISGARGGAAPADRRFYSAAPIFNAGVFSGGVISTVNFQASEARRKKLLNKIFASLVIALFISAFIGFSLSRWLLSPFTKIRAAVLSYAEGDFAPKIAIAASDDIGKIARTLNEMSAKIELLLKSQRDFLADSSHEFKTPLTSIRGASEAIADGVVSEPAEVKNYAARIAGEADYLSELVSDILELSRLESGAAVIQIYPLDIARVFYRTIERYDEAIKNKGLRFEINFKPCDKIGVMAEDKRISKAVKNIIENAIFHSERESVIAVEYAMQDGFYSFKISNQGDPIAGEERLKVFGRFYRRRGEGRYLNASESEVFTGSGLGLAICRQTIETFGGTIEFIEPQPPYDAVLFFKLIKADI